MRGRKALLAVAAVVVIYLIFIHRSAIFVLSEDFRLLRAAAKGYGEGGWSWAEDESGEVREAAGEVEKAGWEVASDIIEEIRWAGDFEAAPDHQPALQRLEEAEKADPENAVINYTRAIILINVPGQSVWKEKALAEVEAGNRKAYYDHYGRRAGQRVYDRALEEGGLPRLLATCYGIGAVASQSLPELARLRELARRASYAAEHYLRIGQPRKALHYARLNSGMADKVYGSSSSGIIDMLTALTVDYIGTSMAAKGARQLGDREAFERVRRRALGSHLWQQRLRPSIPTAWRAVVVWPLVLASTSVLAIFAGLYIAFGLIACLVGRRRKSLTSASQHSRLSSVFLAVLALFSPVPGLLAFAGVWKLQRPGAYEAGGDLTEAATGVGLLFWLAGAAAGCLLFLWLFAPLISRRAVSRRLGRKVGLLRLYNPFSRREEARVLRGDVGRAVLHAGLIMALLLIASFLPAARAMQWAEHVIWDEHEYVTDTVGTLPHVVDADTYKSETNRLVGELLSQDGCTVGRACLGLERGRAYERIPDIISALGEQEDPKLRGRLWDCLRSLAAEVSLQALVPHLMSESGEPNFDAASVIAGSEDPAAREAMEGLLAMMKAEETGVPETSADEADPVATFLHEVAAVIQSGSTADWVEEFAVSLAEGGHKELATEVARRLVQAGIERQSRTFTALGYVASDEAKAIYRQHLEKSGYDYGWGWWPSAMELIDDDLVEHILRRGIDSGKWPGNTTVLVAFAHPRWVPLFLEGLDPRQPADTRYYCAYMLGYAGDEAVVPALAAVLTEPLPEASPSRRLTQREGEQLLMWFDGLRLDYRVLEEDEDGNLEVEVPGVEAHWQVRARATYALGRIGSESARGALEKALRDEHEKVREAARWSLERLDARG